MNRDSRATAKDFIFNVLTQEESKFNKTIDQGLAILAEMQEKMTFELNDYGKSLVLSDIK